jgi:hypothetical protein
LEVIGVRKTINIMALLLFIWLLLDAFNIPGALLNFLLVGQIPGTSIVLSPSQMLAILTVATGTIILEMLASRVGVFRYFKRRFSTAVRQEELPARRRLNRA